MKAVVWIQRIPWSIPLIAAALVCLSWAALARCEELLEGTGRFTAQQIVWSVLGAIAMLAMTIPHYRLICRWSYVLFAASLVLLAAVYAFPPINDAHRWIRLGPIGLQPSEFAKVAFVLALARYLMYRENYRRLSGLIAPLVLTMVPVLLILKEPDLGTAVVLLPVLFLIAVCRGRPMA